MELEAHILGCIFGTAVGDAIGLPREGLSRQRAAKMFGNPPLRHALIAGRGLCSDDTEHTVMVAQALIASGAEPEAFQRDLARRFRGWFLRLPAGVGLGTLRACLKLWLGFGPTRSGVRSAGNGPAMRAALLGVVARDDEHLAQLVAAGTRLTHTDPRALQGAHLIAAAARLATTHEQLAPAEVYATLRPLATDDGLRDGLDQGSAAISENLPATDLANRMGLNRGVGGFVNHTVPVALYCWLKHRGSLRDAVEAAVCLGGDTDTVAAIVGALAGAELGPDAIPGEWIDGLAEWPATPHWLGELAASLAVHGAHASSDAPPNVGAARLFLRNVIFLPIVLFHGFRRLLPPY